MLETEDLKHPELIQRQRLIEAVVEEFEQPLLRYATRIIRNATLAQDVVQSVFVKLFRQWKPNQRPSAALKPWLFHVAHNEAVDVIRAEERRKALHRRWGEEVGRAQASSPCRSTDSMRRGEDACALPDDKRRAVFESLDILSLEERQIVLLRLQQGMSYDEIAAVTRRPCGSVGAILHVAVKKLAAHLQGEEGRAYERE